MRFIKAIDNVEEAKKASLKGVKQAEENIIKQTHQKAKETLLAGKKYVAEILTSYKKGVVKIRQTEEECKKANIQIEAYKSSEVCTLFIS